MHSFVFRELYHSFNFDLQFLYGLMHKVHLFKIVCEIFHFWFRFYFIEVIAQQKA